MDREGTPDGVVSVGQQKLDDVVDSTMFETSIQPNPPPATVGPRLKALLNDEPIDQSNSMESNDWFELEATQPQRSTELESNPEPIEVAHTHGHGTEEEDVVMQNAESTSTRSSPSASAPACLPIPLPSHPVSPDSPAKTSPLPPHLDSSEQLKQHREEPKALYDSLDDEGKADYDDLMEWAQDIEPEELLRLFKKRLETVEYYEDYKTNWETRLGREGSEGFAELVKSFVGSNSAEEGVSKLKETMNGRPLIRFRQLPSSESSIFLEMVNRINATRNGFLYLTSAAGRIAFWDAFFPSIEPFFESGGKVLIAVPTNEMSCDALQHLRLWTLTVQELKGNGELRFIFVSDFDLLCSFHLKEWLLVDETGDAVLALMTSNMNSRGVGVESALCSTTIEKIDAPQSAEAMVMTFLDLRPSSSQWQEVMDIEDFWVDLRKRGQLVYNVSSLDDLIETKEPADLAAQRRAILSDKLLAVLARHRKTSPESSNEKMQDAVSLALSSKSIHENELRPRSSSINESNSKTASRRRVSEILAIKSTVAKRMEGKPGWQIRKRGTKEEISKRDESIIAELKLTFPEFAADFDDPLLGKDRARKEPARPLPRATRSQERSGPEYRERRKQRETNQPGPNKGKSRGRTDPYLLREYWKKIEDVFGNGFVMILQLDSSQARYFTLPPFRGKGIVNIEQAPSASHVIVSATEYDVTGDELDRDKKLDPDRNVRLCISPSDFSVSLQISPTAPRDTKKRTRMSTFDRQWKEDDWTKLPDSALAAHPRNAIRDWVADLVLWFSSPSFPKDELVLPDEVWNHSVPLAASIVSQRITHVTKGRGRTNLELLLRGTLVLSIWTKDRGGTRKGESTVFIKVPEIASRIWKACVPKANEHLLPTCEGEALYEEDKNQVQFLNFQSHGVRIRLVDLILPNRAEELKEWIEEMKEVARDPSLGDQNTGERKVRRRKRYEDVGRSADRREETEETKETEEE